MQYHEKAWYTELEKNILYKQRLNMKIHNKHAINHWQ